METFELNYDEKITVWVRRKYSIKAETLEQAIDDINAEAVDNWDAETIHETEEYMSVKENGGQPTAEILNDDGETIWDNVNLFGKE